MNTKQLPQFLESYSSATSLPIRAYKESHLIYNSELNIPVTMQLLSIDDYILNNDYRYFHPQNMLHVYNLNINNNTFIIVGPIITKFLNSTELASALNELKFLSPLLASNELLNYLNHHRCDKTERIENAVTALHMAINGTALDKGYFDKYVPKHPADTYMPEICEIKWSDFNEKNVKKMQTIVKNGHTEEMKRFFQKEGHLPYGKYAATDLRHFKNSMMVHIYIIRTAAHEGGLDEEICVHLAERYSQKCENARSIEELAQISRTLRLDFCDRVNKLKITRTDSQTINHAISFIHDHRIEHLNADYIAQALGITASYLCSEFKKRTGQSIVEFIANEKIDFAKELLTTTNESILNISNYLCFSSQNYFQTVFKKKVGITPNQYRQNTNIRFTT